LIILILEMLGPVIIIIIIIIFGMIRNEWGGEQAKNNKKRTRTRINFSPSSNVKM